MKEIMDIKKEEIYRWIDRHQQSLREIKNLLKEETYSPDEEGRIKTIKEALLPIAKRAIDEMRVIEASIDTRRSTEEDWEDRIEYAKTHPEDCYLTPPEGWEGGDYLKMPAVHRLILPEDPEGEEAFYQRFQRRLIAAHKELNAILKEMDLFIYDLPYDIGDEVDYEWYPRRLCKAKIIRINKSQVVIEADHLGLPKPIKISHREAKEKISLP